MFAINEGNDSVFDGVSVTGGSLHQATTACGQVMNNSWRGSSEHRHINHVDVGLVSRSKYATIK
jgi:hypothetical protein